jgi:hypothetical protein
MFNELIEKFPKLSFLSRREFQNLPEANQRYLKDLIEDALFWIDLEKKPNGSDGFKFLAAAYGLDRAQKEASSQGLGGKAREKFLKPHQDLFTVYNPYSGNGGEGEAV